MSVSKNRGTWKWMVYFMEILLKWMIWEEKNLFLEMPPYVGWCITFDNQPPPGSRDQNDPHQHFANLMHCRSCAIRPELRKWVVGILILIYHVLFLVNLFIMQSTNLFQFWRDVGFCWRNFGFVNDKTWLAGFSNHLLNLRRESKVRVLFITAGFNPPHPSTKMNGSVTLKHIWALNQK